MFRRDRLMKRLARCRILVTLKTGEAFDGILWDIDRYTMVLADSKAYPANGGDPIPADGKVYLARSDVAYLQNAKE